MPFNPWKVAKLYLPLASCLVFLVLAVHAGAKGAAPLVFHPIPLTDYTV
jgi:hypothetical protein